MSRFFNLKGLPMSDDDMQSILAAVENAIPEMYDGKAYTLKDLVCILIILSINYHCNVY